MDQLHLLAVYQMTRVAKKRIAYKGFFQVKKIQKIREKLGSGWVGVSSSNSDYYFFLNILCFFVCFLRCFHVSKCFQKNKKKWIEG